MHWTVIDGIEWNSLGRPTPTRTLEASIINDNKDDKDKDKQSTITTLYLFKSEQIQQLQEIQREISKILSENQDIQTRLKIKDIEATLKEHIVKMHEYNEIKDNVQLLLGKLSEFQGCTIKEMYKKYDLDFND